MSQQHNVKQNNVRKDIPTHKVNATSGSREAAPKVSAPGQHSFTQNPFGSKRAGDGEKHLRGTNPRINTTNKRK